MTDNRELEVAFAKRGIKKNVVAKELGISLNSLRRKATNQTQFKADEICKLIKIMNLTADELIAIFFKEEINGNKKPRGGGAGHGEERKKKHGGAEADPERRPVGAGSGGHGNISPRGASARIRTGREEVNI